jgi:hypothetical protein
VFIRRALDFWRFWRAVRFSARAVEWTAADATRLREFLGSDTGLKLGRALRQVVGQSALSAVHVGPSQSSLDLPWRCGRAAGMAETSAYLDTLAAWRVDGLEEALRNNQDDRPNLDLSWLNDREHANSRTG